MIVQCPKEVARRRRDGIKAPLTRGDGDDGSGSTAATVPSVSKLVVGIAADSGIRARVVVLAVRLVLLLAAGGVVVVMGVSSSSKASRS